MDGFASKVIAVRVNTTLGDRLEAQARRENNHISAVTRRLLTAALDREDEAALSRRPLKRTGSRQSSR